MNVSDAAQSILSGGIIALPTEGVYGLSCHPNQSAALHRLIDLKQRPDNKGLILVAANQRQLDGYVDWQKLPIDRQRVVWESWPGPFTWIVPAKPTVSQLILGQHRGVAVRVTDHPLLAELCLLCQSALVSTSANFHGQPAVRTSDALDPELVKQLEGVISDQVGNATGPSTIRDAVSGVVLR